jgi:Protein of unknown function (DUF3108)
MAVEDGCGRAGGGAANHRNDAFSDKTGGPQIHAVGCRRVAGIAVTGPPSNPFRAASKGSHPFVFVPSQPLTRRAASALAVAAAVVVVAAADSGRVAAAQGRLDAEYVVTIAGLPIGRGSWTVDIAEDQFSASASGATTGLLQFFTGAHGTSVSRGTLSGGQLVPTSYVATINYDRGRVDDVRMALSGGNVKDYSVEPPLKPNPDLVPVSDADRRGVLDPMTASLDRVAGSGDPLMPEACNRKTSVFDGRLRYDLQSEFKRVEAVKADHGYQGPVIVCAVYFQPISGYVPERPAIKYLVALRDAEVWLAPIAGTRVLVPFRFSVPTPIGLGVLQATQFVSTARPPRSAAAAKTQ